jgi:hypothetical protein
MGFFFHIGGRFYQLNPADFAEGTAKVRLSSEIPNRKANIFPPRSPVALPKRVLGFLETSAFRWPWREGSWLLPQLGYFHSAQKYVLLAPVIFLIQSSAFHVNFNPTLLCF